MAAAPDAVVVHVVGEHKENAAFQDFAGSSEGYGGGTWGAQSRLRAPGGVAHPVLHGGAFASEEDAGKPLDVPGPDYCGGGWVQQEDARGETYFYNLRTGARQTERPAEDQIDRS